MNELFVFSLTLISLLMIYFGNRILPRGEGWQMLATLPVRRLPDGNWQGINLTWYGLLTANAYLAALTVLIVLLGAARIPLTGVMLLATVMLAICVPASRLVARIVEGKSHTFTVGGAVFVGIICAPFVVKLVNALGGYTMPLTTTFAAISIAYAFGEGLGRLACISFGCCYGKRVADCSPFVRRMFARWNYSFHGDTRKICYADNLGGQAVVPIQSITALLYTLTGAVGTELFLHGHYAPAFALVLSVTQLWRVFSEFMRADFRGKSSFSAYQIMGLAAIPYALACSWFWPGEASASSQLATGLSQLWHPGTLIFLQMIWITLFIYTGRSTVTGANLSFHVHHDRT